MFIVAAKIKAMITGISIAIITAILIAKHIAIRIATIMGIDVDPTSSLTLRCSLGHPP